MVRCCDKARVIGYMWFAPGCEGTLKHANVHLSVLPSEAWGVSVAGVLPAPGGTSRVAAPCVMKVEFEDGEVSKGAAKESGKPFHTAPIIVASLIRPRSSKDVKRVPKLQEKSCPPPPCLPLHKENSISCVCISFSVTIKWGTWQPIINMVTEVSAGKTQASRVRWEVNLLRILIRLAVKVENRDNLLVNILSLPPNSGGLLVL